MLNKSGISFLIMDVDGTLTDGNIYMGNSGEMFKAFNIKDGYGINHLLPKHGIEPIIITARESQITVNRCKELNITRLYQNCSNKRQKLIELAGEMGMECDADGKYPTFAYIGDDIIDIPCMELCGIVGCPEDAVEEVKKISDFTSVHKGGQGAVRDFIEWIVGEKSTIK